MKKYLWTTVFILVFALSGAAQKKPFSISISGGRTAKFEPTLTKRQFNISITAAYSFKKRWAWQFGITTPIDFSGVTYRTGLAFRIY